MRNLKLLSLALLACLCSSCIVSQQKYDRCEKKRLAAIYSRDSLATLLGSARTDFDILKGEQAALTSKHSQLTEQYGKLNKVCETLKQDTVALGGKLRNAQSQLNSVQARLKDNRNENATLNEQLNQRLQELSEREQTIQQLQGVINEQNERVRGLLDNVKSALTGFDNDQLTVREEGGKVYVAMSEKLLFASGKATVNEQGRVALGRLAEVLNKQTDIDITIEGHTDSQPIKTAQFADNWDLSVIRATSVVRILTEVYKVNPLQILPCGRGEYRPIDTNSTADGRSHNRRTEIIISPKLDKLYEIITAQHQ